MKLLIDITPVLNKWCPTEKEFIKLFESTVSRELGMADLDGTLNSVEEVIKINEENG